VQSQLSSNSKRSWNTWAGSLLIAAISAACTPEETAPTSPLTIVARGDVGFGATLAAGGTAGTLQMLGGRASSQPGAQRIVDCSLQFSLAGHSTPVCTEVCVGQGCGWSPEQFGHLWHPSAAEEEHCFVTGVEPSGQGGLPVRCKSSNVTLELPEWSTLTETNVGAWRLAADLGPSPLLAVASPREGRAWYYPPGTTMTVELTSGVAPPPPGFASDVVVMRLGSDRFSSRLVAISALDEVWLFRVGFPEPETSIRIGCLGQRPGFGKRLTSGDVDGDGYADLVVADAEFVTVFSGGALAMMGEQDSPACALSSLPAAGILASVSCASGGLTSGCVDAEFGASLAVADLDGDLDGELLVGAPEMTVAGERRGAVLIYDAEGLEPHALTESVTSDSLPPGARFGATLAVVPGQHTDAIVVGAPAAGEVYLATCFSLTSAELRPKLCDNF
jgi:hypothetical protein